MSRLRNGWEALQSRLKQSAETVTRNARIDISGGDVDEIDPPEDIDEFAKQAKKTGLVRANLRQFVQDVMKPGIRLDGPDETVAYFLGEQEHIDASPPAETPEGGFLENAFIYSGERQQDFYHGVKQTIWERWTRATVLIEYLKEDKESAESRITGFHFIRPETVYPQVRKNTNILLDPDDTDKDGAELTPRGEAAAYIQFDDQSILGRRRGGYENDAVPLSQNDVMKQTLEPDIGGPGNDDGVFGTSPIESITTDIEEYHEMKRDRARAVKKKAYGIYSAQFKPEVIEMGNGNVEVIEWDPGDISDTEDELDSLGPGDILSSDANIDLRQYESDVPDLDSTLSHYVNDILAALPAPKYATAFGEDVANHVSDRQENSYNDTIEEERQYQGRKWTAALKLIAERQGLSTDGLQVRIEPEEDDSPVMSMSDDEIEKLQNYAEAMSSLAGGQRGGVATLIDREAILTEIAQLPEDAVSDVDLETLFSQGQGASSPPDGPIDEPDGDEDEPDDPPGDPDPDEDDGDDEDDDGDGDSEALESLQEGVDSVQEQIESLEDTPDVDADTMYADWSEMVGFNGAEALAAFAEGDEVETPDGVGVVSEIRTESFEGPDGEEFEPTEDEPAYVVATEGGAGVYAEDELEDGELPEIDDVDSPESDLEALFDLADAVDEDAEALQEGHFSWPESWQESSTPARVIALKAWAGMGGRHTGCVREMRGSVTRPNAFCADFKDRILGWEGWRRGG